MHDDSSVPYGYCHCGCGLKTNIAKRTYSRRGEYKGEPRRYIKGHHGRNVLISHEEEDRGHETPCWVWQHSTNGDGYGYFYRNKKYFLAHRYYYETHVGMIPDGLEIDHLCRQHDCVNPAHLEPVTGTENVRRGISTLLDWESVEQIRQLHEAGGKTLAEIGAMFGVGKHAVWRVVHKKNWRDP